MNLPANNNSEVRAEQAANKQHQTIKLGVDIHADFYVVTRMLDQSGPQPAQCFSPVDYLKWVKKQQDLAEKVYSCYEAGPFGYVLHRKLEELGVRNVVVQPVCLDERYTGVNHDKSDSRELAQRLDRLVSGNRHAMAVVRVPTAEQEQRRCQSRQREQLRRTRQRLEQQGRSLLLTQGFREKRAWWLGGRWKELQSRLPQWLSQSLEVFRRLLQAVNQELKQLTKDLRESAAQKRLYGMGAYTYAVVEREVGDWNRFNNRRQAASYTGLCGGVSASGNSSRQLSITKHGNVRLRTALVEMAWRLLKFQPDCKLVKKWAPILGNPRASKAARKKAIVAIARQLMVDLWRWRTGRVRPEQLGWRMTEQ